MSVGEVVATLNATCADIAEQQQRVLLAADRIDQAVARLLAVVGPSSNPHPHAAIQRLAFAAHGLRDAARLLAEATDRIGTYVAVITGATAGLPASRLLAQPPNTRPAPGEASRDSRGRAVPPGVKRLPSGKYPANFEYAGRVYDGPTWTGKMAEKYPDGVRFTHDGFPDFEPYAAAKVTFEPGFAGNHTTDFAEANRKAGLAELPAGYTWHHHQNVKTMLLVPKDLHLAVRHAGGVAIMKGRE